MTLSPIDVLLWSLVLALGAVALTTILRNAPWIRGQVQALKKPWACNVCMPLYTVAGLGVALGCATKSWLVCCAAYLPAYALTNVALDALARPPTHVPEEFMQIEDSEDEIEGLAEKSH